MSRIRVDWFRVMCDLQGKGYSLVNIAAAIGVAHSTLMGWRNPPYAEPRHADGERLVMLWCQVTEAPRDALPLNVEDMMSAARACARIPAAKPKKIDKDPARAPACEPERK